VTSPGRRDEAQIGVDGRRVPLGPLPRLCERFLGHLLCPTAIVAGADLSLRRQFDFDGSNPDPRWVTVHALVGAEWGEVLTDETVLRLSVDLHHGVNPHGQFREEALSYLGLTLQLDL
jgi:hypothetical protein